MSLQGHEQSGSVWHPKAHRAEGSWRIEARGDNLLFRLGADFRTDWGPDVKLYLVTQEIGEIGILGVDLKGITPEVIAEMKARFEFSDRPLELMERNVTDVR